MTKRERLSGPENRVFTFVNPREKIRFFCKAKERLVKQGNNQKSMYNCTALTVLSVIQENEVIGAIL